MRRVRSGSRPDHIVGLIIHVTPSSRLHRLSATDLPATSGSVTGKECSSSPLASREKSCGKFNKIMISLILLAERIHGNGVPEQ